MDAGWTERILDVLLACFGFQCFQRHSTSPHILILPFIKTDRMMSVLLLAFIGSACAFAPIAHTRVAVRTLSPTMGIFDNLSGKGNFYEDESPRDEKKAFEARGRKQVEKLSPGGGYLWF